MLTLSEGELEDWIKAKKDSVDHSDVENVGNKLPEDWSVFSQWLPINLWISSK